MRVALYARYSSDLQNQRSAEDQFAALRLVVQARGWQEVAAFSDLGISGANLNNRPGVQTLLREAERGAFDVVFTEALDRLSRDQEGTAHLYKRLSFYGAALETLSEGRISELHVGLSGTMNQMFLVELGKKTRRGLLGRVKEGFSGGGRCYGYNLVEGQTGVFEIDRDQAGVINRIFRDYAAGKSPRTIAHALNSEGVPGPRGGDWTPSAIYGDRRARDGILCQELYIGVRVYNRRRFRKHPDTGKRSSVLNPESDWMREAVPGLRIVDNGLWAAAANRQQALSEQPAYYGRKPKRLLSGLMKCSVCGSGMTMNGQKFACSAARERGTCTNRKLIAAKTIEARVLEGIAAKLLAPEAIGAAVSSAQKEAADRQRQTLSTRAPMERELAEIARKLDRAQTLCIDGAMEIEELKRRSLPLKARRAELGALLAEVDEPAVLSLHPGVAEAYRRMAEQLREALDDVDGEDARDAVRALIERVEFIPVEGLGQFDLEIHGNLARLLRISGAAEAGARTHKSPAASGSGASEVSHRCEVLVGAGAGFEPATFRL
ncbi:recombinase family protein [Brevundimonas sp. R86498]|uniref:recombinase family protein n=1 Tax=Brevundimonas sp. R86498 TaxID=3093845 RepID=UPI0037CC0E7C